MVTTLGGKCRPCARCNGHHTRWEVQTVRADRVTKIQKYRMLNDTAQEVPVIDMQRLAVGCIVGEVLGPICFVLSETSIRSVVVSLRLIVNVRRKCLEW